MPQIIRTCFPLDHSGRNTVYRSYMQEMLEMLAETAAGNRLLRVFATELLECTAGLSEEQLKALLEKLESADSTPAERSAFRPFVHDMLKGLPKPKPAAKPKEEPLHPEPEINADPPKAAEKKAAAVPDSKPEKPKSKMVWSWSPDPGKPDSKPEEAKKSEKKPAANPAAAKKSSLPELMQNAITNCARIAFLPQIMTRSGKGGKLFHAGTGGSNGIICVTKEGRLKCLNAAPGWEKELNSWEKLKSIQSFEQEGVITGLRTDGKQCLIGSGYQPALTPFDPLRIPFQYRAEKGLQAACYQRMQHVSPVNPVADYAIGYDFYLILLADGTVLSGDRESENRFAQATDRWKHIISISVSDYVGVGLDVSGHVHLISKNNATDDAVLPWERVIAVKSVNRVCAGLLENGRLITDQVISGLDLTTWTDLAAFTVRDVPGMKAPQFFAVSNSGKLHLSGDAPLKENSLPADLTPLH